MKYEVVAIIPAGKFVNDILPTPKPKYLNYNGWPMDKETKIVRDENGVFTRVEYAYARAERCDIKQN